MKIPDKYKVIWEKSYPLLQQGRPGDDNHALEVVDFVLTHADPDHLDVLVPVAIICMILVTLQYCPNILGI